MVQAAGFYLSKHHYLKGSFCDTESELTTPLVVEIRQKAEERKGLRQKRGYQGGFGMRGDRIFQVGQECDHLLSHFLKLVLNTQKIKIVNLKSIV